MSYTTKGAVPPILHAHRGESIEPWRIDRLQNVVRLTAVAVALTGSTQRWDGAIELMHDRKGYLSVFWRSKCDWLEFHGFLKWAWRAQEEAVPIHHFWRENQLVVQAA